ncbi:MAG: hypothetical protein EAZ86_12105 [Oscillatoriales cyanobacterium]|nr:MAG: hypothetical protein EAZ86_12105 [Oscillatoriales cyanobacterium]
MPYALCPMPYALCPMPSRPRIFLRKAISCPFNCLLESFFAGWGRFIDIVDINERLLVKSARSM